MVACFQQTSLHRYDSTVSLISLLDQAVEPGVCPDCSADIHGPLSLIPLPGTVDAPCTKGWFCEDCRTAIVLPAGAHAIRMGGSTGYHLADLELRTGDIVTIEIPAST